MMTDKQTLILAKMLIHISELKHAQDALIKLADSPNIPLPERNKIGLTGQQLGEVQKGLMVTEGLLHKLFSGDE